MTVDSTAKNSTVKIPMRAVGDGDDVLIPTAQFLRGMNLLGNEPDYAKAEGFVSAFSGAPTSVGLIEAGATALSKWWSAGAGAAIIAMWGGIRIWWSGIESDSQVTVLWVGGIATAAAILAIGCLLSSDVKGRADASVATIQARAQVATAMLRAAGQAGPPHTHEQIRSLASLDVKNLLADKYDQSGWKAISMRAGAAEYLLTKGARNMWVDSSAIAPMN